MKKLFCLVISTIVLFTTIPFTCFARETWDYNGETIETISAEEYYLAKSEATGVPYEILLEEAALSAQSVNSTVYKKYTKTFSYSQNSRYKADLGGYFTLEGYGNYYDIKECGRVFTRLSSSSVSCEWLEDAAYYTGLSASSCTLIGGGRFRDNYSAGVSIPIGFSLSTTMYIMSQDLNMRTTVTAAQLKSAPSV